MERTQFEEFNGHKLATVFHDSGGKKVVIFLCNRSEAGSNG